jgi:osmoprotectant transport system permease protein
MKKYLIPITLIFNFILPTLAQTTLKVGGESFNESYILAELIGQILEDGGYRIEKNYNLGGTAVSFEALKKKAIDVYPAYSGTISREILKQKVDNLTELNGLLKQKWSLEISAPYGFNNTYALCVTPTLAARLNLKKISDLQGHPDLKLGFSSEFISRADGWVNLSKRYALKNKVFGMEHALSYQALMSEKIDMTDAYSTDGEIDKYKLVLLEDDLDFFPKYEAVSFYQSDLPENAKKLLKKLDHVLTDTAMQRLNSEAVFLKKRHADIARAFLLDKKLIQNNVVQSLSKTQDIANHIFIHLKLTLLSLIAAFLVAIPLGIVLYRFPRFAQPVLYLTGILQTIPSIALLALMIPLTGIGVLPAVIALFLYALLPILRNTVIGLSSVDPTLKKVATAIGLNTFQKLRLIELPLAMPMILAGIRMAAVMNVGTATLAAFIGGGGLGEFIVTGLALNDTNLILMGAIPAALLAIVLELLFELLEKALISKHLRQKN